MLAVVVDDDMNVAVIRGDDHLNNAARQMLIYKAMAGHPSLCPRPANFGEDGKKLSKRHGATAMRLSKWDINFRYAQLPSPSGLEPWKR